MWWIFALLIAFSITMGVVAAGDNYNNFSKNLAAKTNDIIILPVVKALPFSLGLDLQGGAHLVYQADMTGIAEADRSDALESVRDVVERRVNAFGVSEPVVQANKTATGEYRIIAELAGMKDVQEAIKMIGETPILEFKEQDEAAIAALQSQQAQTPASGTPIQNIVVASGSKAAVDLSGSAQNQALDVNAGWKSTGLTGKYLKRSSVQFNPNDGSPEVSLEFNSEGATLFEEITARNIGKPVAIFLDGYPISTPNVNEKISGGQASISGKFSIDEAKILVKRLNSGALPVPISLISQKTVEASLGTKSIDNSLVAGLIGLLLVSIFMIIVYRLPGLMSVFSLVIYGLTVLAIFKALPVWLALVMVAIIIALIFYVFNELKIFTGSLAFFFSIFGILLFFYALKPVTLTVAGIAGFILSLGMAVDANVLIFARIREEFKAGKSIKQSVEEGFRRAWPSIRDGNFSTIITCLILMFFGTSTIQGFGTTLFIGIVISMFSSMVITHLLLQLVSGPWLEKRPWILGVRKK
jgi:protein-export membrane protein SecD